MIKLNKNSLICLGYILSGNYFCMRKKKSTIINNIIIYMNKHIIIPIIIKLKFFI